MALSASTVIFNADMQLQLVELANQYHLMITGGSDFHGTNKPDIELGFGKNNLKIDYEVLEKIKKTSFYYIDYESSVVPRGPENHHQSFVWPPIM